MQGTEATIGDVSFGRVRASGGGARPFIMGAAVAATVGCIAAYGLHARHGAAPTGVKARIESSPAAEADPAKLFGAIIIEPEWRDQIAQRPESQITLPSLGPETLALATAPPPALLAAPPSPPAATAPPAVANILPDAIPLPPVRDVPRIDDSVPLPPARPPEFAEPAPSPTAPERRVAEPAPASAPA